MFNKEYYSQSDLLNWPVAGLFIFVTIFIGVLAYVIFGLRDKKKISEITSLPLELDTGEDQIEGRAN